MLISGQTPDTAGSIKVVRCHECADIVVKLPDVEYPRYLGYGAHKAEGEVGVQVVIDENGDVESAKGISGHPYFRPMLEKASLTAKFKPTIVDGKAIKKKAVIFYQITLSNTTINLPILNGRATVLPKAKYTQQLENLCAYGRVEIEVLLDGTGSVLETTPLLGDELLFPIVIEAAKQSKV